ncbi:MAG: hypothetical protein JXA58_05330, partial [Dehalococcoidia bacterium]|nr:hypothetical protein [Dehalococcoidia bacterium]
QGRVCDADANAALIALDRNLAGPDVAVISLASIAATLGNVELCPCLYVVLHHQALRADGTGATLRLSVFEVGGCRAEGVELRLAFPPVVSVIGARAAERGIISVTPHEIVARLGGLEPHSCSSLFVDIVDRAEGGVDSALADLVSGAASPLDISAL